MLVLTIQERNHSLHVFVFELKLLVVGVAASYLVLEFLFVRFKLGTIRLQPVTDGDQPLEFVPKFLYYYFFLVCHACTKIDIANVRLFFQIHKIFRYLF